MGLFIRENLTKEVCVTSCFDQNLDNIEQRSDCYTLAAKCSVVFDVHAHEVHHQPFDHKVPSMIQE